MTNKVFVGTIVIVLAIGTYVFYSRYNNSPEDENYASETGITFNCVDGSSFLAEFSSDFEKLNIVEKDVVVRSLSKSSGNTRLYTDNSYTYTFAGQEVKVNNVGTGARTSCDQPFNISRAPYNFGDPGEGGGQPPDLSLVVKESIVGTWESVDDANFTREFKADGTIIDTYPDEEDSQGNWEVFTKASDLETAFPLEDGTAYLKITMGEKADEVLYFQVTKITPEELELIYLERGNTLRFTALK